MTPARRLILQMFAALGASALSGCAHRGVSLPRDPVARRVEEIVEAIAALPPGRVSEQAQGALFDELIALGPAAVPAIIALMDDRRPLPVSQITFTNLAPNAFEGLRHYGPDLMVDALAAVLNQITAQHFGFIYNGGTESERAETVAGWRGWLQAHPDYPAEH